ncbi:hypothetical protein [Streptomyces sp. NPDC086010]|uniref:hypothetical protein n=1 Tax=Streptomyces sp. NPDC086010 TaxID=3365745 RepID=UPI0037D74792
MIHWIRGGLPRHEDPGIRYGAIDVARSLITSLRGDHTRLVRLIGHCLLLDDAYTAAAAAERAA